MWPGVPQPPLESAQSQNGFAAISLVRLGAKIPGGFFQTGNSLEIQDASSQKKGDGTLGQQNKGVRTSPSEQKETPATDAW